MKKLEETAKFSSGGTPSRNNLDYWNGEYSWVTTSLIDYNTITLTDEYITEEGLKNSSAKLFPVGTILMAMYGQGKTRGKVAILGIEASTNQACLGIIAKSEILNEIFLFQNLGSRYDEIRNLSNGGSQENLSAELVRKLKLTFPTLPEQTKIANFLTATDQKIETLKEKKSQIQQYKKGIMQQLFSQELRFKNNNGEDYPDWEYKSLGEIGEFKNGINKSKEDFGHGFPFINLMDVFGKATISDLKLDLVNANEKELKQYELRKGDVLFIRSSVKKSGVGETSLVLEDLKNTVYSGFLIRFRDEKIKLDMNFKKYCFAFKKFRESLISLSTTSANTNINQESLNILELPIPSLPEQIKIANFLTAIDEKIEKVNQQITNTQTFKKGLLQQMFC